MPRTFQETALHRMIHAQAEAVDRLAEADLAQAAERLAGARRVLLLGTGTSQHAAELGAMMLGHAGVDARWSSAAQFARWGAPLRSGDAVVVITHTAETAFALRCREQALAAGVPTVSITGVGTGDWPEAVETVAKEQSETYTVSYTAALTVLAGLAHRLGAESYGPEQLHRAAEAIREAGQDPGLDAVALPARALAVIGAGPWGVTAREGALKVREAARILAEGYESELYLHGSAVPFGAADGLLLLEPGADQDGLTAALGAAAAAEGITVGTLSATGAAAELPPVLAQLPLTVRLQLLAGHWAELRHQNPDVAIVGAWAKTELWGIGAP
ncbi:SIS domain-containing protein [Kitasatospora terrestris]|uniref:Glutamine--fructose-6-phosphate aminotransferase [isomerizing] n=1 Tax=Kitasatospora terrestris TaxID=258051 RepID=A0ABP9E758_9ACTN